MTKFNAENKAVLTYGDCLHPAMCIFDQEDAQQYFDEYVRHVNSGIRNYALSVDICKSNLKTFAAYVSDEAMERIDRLFIKGCVGGDVEVGRGTTVHYKK